MAKNEIDTGRKRDWGVFPRIRLARCVFVTGVCSAGGVRVSKEWKLSRET